MGILNLKTGTFVNILHKFREEGTNVMTTYLERE